MKTKDQIKVLRRVLFNLRVNRIFEKESYGLCIMLAEEMACPLARVNKNIPLFNRNNAYNFGALKGEVYWWTEKDFKSRIRFVKWMINELKKQHENN